MTIDDALEDLANAGKYNVSKAKIALFVRELSAYHPDDVIAACRKRMHGDSSWPDLHDLIASVKREESARMGTGDWYKVWVDADGNWYADGANNPYRTGAI